MNANQFNQWLTDPRPRVLVMGILNVTPDSFSDGGRYAGVESAVKQARQMIAAGADLLDIGGESTRPGAVRVAAEEQISRVVPVIEAIRRESDIAISVDTTLAAVAEAALAAGATLLNDIAAGREDTRMFQIAAQQNAPIVLMHMQGEPGTMQESPVYADVTAEVTQFLAQRAAEAVSRGIARQRILLDPGIGFGKALEHNLQLLRDLPRLGELGYRLLVGTSRKRFIGAITGIQEPAGRVIGSCVSAAYCVSQGAHIIRAHDVAEHVQAVRMAEALRDKKS